MKKHAWWEIYVSQNATVSHKGGSVPLAHRKRTFAVDFLQFIAVICGNP